MLEPRSFEDPNISSRSVNAGDIVTVKLRVKRECFGILVLDPGPLALNGDNGKLVVTCCSDMVESVETPEPPKPAELPIPPVPAPGTAKVVMIGHDVYTRCSLDMWASIGDVCHGYVWSELVKMARSAGEPLVLLDATKAVR